MELDPCRTVHAVGVEYTEWSCQYPQIAWTYFEWEKRYNPLPVMEWMENRPLVPILTCILYMLLIWVGRRCMDSREPWRWRSSLAAWNLMLSAFSFIGVFRTLPALAHIVSTMSPRDVLCSDPLSNYGIGSSGLWVQLFILSKFPELIDTFFIVIHKKKLLFLHWYHHITVLLYCWHSYVTKSPPGLIFVVMNYFVHACMYGYYALMALRMRPKWLDPKIITALQISQMIVGVSVSAASFFYYLIDDRGTCQIQSENNTAAFIMYGSYLFLFLQFFVGRYYKGTFKVIYTKKQT